MLTTQIFWMTPSDGIARPVEAALADFALLAWLFAVPGLIGTVIDVGQRLGEAAETAAATQRATAKYGSGAAKQTSAQGKQKQVFLGRCWEGPFCRDNIRVKCPIYLRKRGPCWWYKEGCMCEERIVLQAMISADWKKQSYRGHAGAGNAKARAKSCRRKPSGSGAATASFTTSISGRSTRR